MNGVAKWQIDIKSNIDELRKELEHLKKNDVELRLDINTEELDKAMSNINKLLTSLGKGSNDFKQFEKLANQLSSVEKSLLNISKGFGNVDSGNTDSLLFSIKNIDNSLSQLSQHIMGIQKNFTNIDASSAVSQLNNVAEATERAVKAQQELNNTPSPQKSGGGRKKKYANNKKVSEDDFKDDYLGYAKLADDLLKDKGRIILGNTSDVELLENGLVSVQATIKDTDGAWKKFTAKIDGDLNILDEKCKVIKSGIAKLNKDLVAQQNGYPSKGDKPKLTLDEIKKQEAKIRDSLKLDGKFEIKVDDSGFVTISQKLSEVSSGAKTVKQSFESATDAIDNFGKDGSSAAEKTVVSFKNVENQVNNVSNATKSDSLKFNKLGYDISDYLTDNTRLSKGFREELAAIRAECANPLPNSSYEQLSHEFSVVKSKIKSANEEGRRFFDRLKDNTVSRAIQQLALYFVSFADIIRYLREGFEIVKEIDIAFTEMRKVSDEGLSSLREYQSRTFDIANEVGSTGLQIEKSTADWMRLGESIREAEESAKSANILFNVSEFENIDSATQALVSTSQAFKDLDKMEIVDVINKIGNEYSIATDELASALQNSSAALVTQGNDLAKSVALLTAGNAITQDASKTASGVRTISLRIAGTEQAKDELASLGEDADDYVVQTKSKTQEIIKSYTAVASNEYEGVDVLDPNGNLKDTYSIMLEISKIYQEILEEDKKAGTNRGQALVEVLGGKNRSNIVSSMLLNSELLEKVYKSAQNATGSAEEELQKQLDSIEGKMTKLSNAGQEFWHNFLDSETLKTGIDLITNLVKGINKLMELIGTLPTLGSVMAGVYAFKNVGRVKLY